MKWMGMVYNEMHPGISSADTILLSSFPTELTPHCIQGLEDNLTLRILEQEKKPKTKYHRQILSKSSSSASLLSSKAGINMTRKRETQIRKVEERAPRSSDPEHSIF